MLNLRIIEGYIIGNTNFATMKQRLTFGIFGFIILMMLMGSCSSSETDKRYVPYTFDQNNLDSLVKLKIVILDEVKREDATVQERRYYLGDSVKYILTYNKSAALLNVSKYEGAHEVWTENFYPNGQRMSRFTMFTDPETGASYYQGAYQSYYQTGWLKEEGYYKRDKPFWMLPYTENGLSGDTIFYEYQEAESNSTEPIEIP